MRYLIILLLVSCNSIAKEGITTSEILYCHHNLLKNLEFYKNEEMLIKQQIKNGKKTQSDLIKVRKFLNAHQVLADDNFYLKTVELFLISNGMGENQAINVAREQLDKAVIKYKNSYKNIDIGKECYQKVANEVIMDKTRIIVRDYLN